MGIEDGRPGRLNLVKNKTKHELIESGHNYRGELLQSLPDIYEFNEYLIEETDTLDIIKKVPRNKLRAFKKILLSQSLSKFG